VIKMLLVTGITGHTGRYFIEELINNNFESPIRCIVRKTSNTTFLDASNLNIEKVIGDLENQELLEKLMVGVETVFHIYNIHHSPNILRAAIKNNVRRVILVHTTGIYSQFKYASQGYKIIENEVSELTKETQCSPIVTILRPTMIYGDLCDKNISKFIKLVDKLRFIPVINRGKSTIQPVNARDLGKAYYSVLISSEITKGKVYDLSGERPIQMIDVLRIISKELNKKTVYINIPLATGVFLARIAKTLTFGKIDFVEKVQRMGEDRGYSHHTAKKDFNYSPMAFENGLKVEVQEYLKKNK
jgi:uncharacterized protein YbjT (DUF2867 family)